MDTKLDFFPGPFLSLQASKVIPHLLESDNVVIGGHSFWPGFDAGTAAFPAMSNSGYIWPYYCSGQSVNDQPDVWFALPNFRAPNQCLNQFLYLRSDYLIRQTGDRDECWRVREEPLSEHVVALVPQHPNQASNDLLQEWRQDNARQFLLLGGLDTYDVTVLLSDLPIGCPLSWQEAELP